MTLIIYLPLILLDSELVHIQVDPKKKSLLKSYLVVDDKRKNSSLSCVTCETRAGHTPKPKAKIKPITLFFFVFFFSKRLVFQSHTLPQMLSIIKSNHYLFHEYFVYRLGLTYEKAINLCNSCIKIFNPCATHQWLNQQSPISHGPSPVPMQRDSLKFYSNFFSLFKRQLTLTKNRKKYKRIKQRSSS